jgi:hypothetical protein
MKRLKIYTNTLLTTLLVAFATSCSEELLSLTQKEEIVDGRDINISFSLDLPEMGKGTRGFGETLEDASNAKIYLFAFDNNHLLTNIFEGTYQREIDETDAITNKTIKHQYYNVDIKESSEPRYYHVLVNHNNLDLSKIAYGTESDVFSSNEMIVGPDKDVYWQRVYMSEVTEDTAKAKLQHLKMVRNFCRISLTINKNKNDSDMETNTLTKAEWGLGYIPTKSYVAPYIGGQEFAGYVKENADGSSTLATYDDLTTVQGYSGFVPRTVDNKDTFYDVIDNFDDNVKFQSVDKPLYCYENEGTNVSSLYQKTMIFLRGNYVDENGKEDDDLTYYRIGLVDDAENDYAQLNMLRNIEYNVTIDKVTAAGYTSAQAASQRPANNNLSGSTLTSEYPVVANETGAFRVEYIRKYIVSPDTFSLNYRYVPDITKTNSDGSYVSDNDKVEITTTNGEKLNVLSNDKNETKDKEVSISESEAKKTSVADVFSKVTVSSTDINGSNYRKVIFKPNEDNLKNGESTSALVRFIASGTAFYRDVEFILRERYKMDSLAIIRDETYKGYDEDNNFVYGSEDCYTLTVNVPNNIPDEMFPLDFTFETIPAIVYPNESKSIMEVNGEHPSIFDASLSNTFHFHRAVTTKTYKNTYTDNHHGYGGFVDDAHCKKISFFFKLNTPQFEKILNLNKNNEKYQRDYVIIRFGIYNPIFSSDPEKDIKASTPQILEAYYKFTEDGTDSEGNNVYKAELVTLPEGTTELPKDDNGYYYIKTSSNTTDK